MKNVENKNTKHGTILKISSLKHKQKVFGVMHTLNESALRNHLIPENYLAEKIKLNHFFGVDQNIYH